MFSLLLHPALIFISYPSTFRSDQHLRLAFPRLDRQSSLPVIIFASIFRPTNKEPVLPPLRLLRESSGGVLRLRHMALGDPHVMAVMASLDHLPSLTSIDVADNR